MEYLNSKRIVHTDLSAKNVLIADGIIAKITGFGMAKILSNGDTLKMGNCFLIKTFHLNKKKRKTYYLKPQG